MTPKWLSCGATVKSLWNRCIQDRVSEPLKAPLKEFLRNWHKEPGVKKVKVPMNYKNDFESPKIASGKLYPQILQWNEAKVILKVRCTKLWLTRYRTMYKIRMIDQFPFYCCWFFFNLISFFVRRILTLHIYITKRVNTLRNKMFHLK